MTVFDIFRIHRRTESIEAKLENIERTQELILASLADLTTALDAAPTEITNAVVAAVQPFIGTGGTVDTQPQIDQVNALPAAVASAVTAALQPAPPAP